MEEVVLNKLDMVDALEKKGRQLEVMIKEERSEQLRLLKENEMLRRLAFGHPIESDRVEGDGRWDGRYEAAARVGFVRLKLWMRVYKYLCMLTWIGIPIYWLLGNH